MLNASFLIVTWNSANYIDRCIKSIQMSRDYDDKCYEIIVVDNGSHDVDATSRIVNHYGAQFISLRRNCGLGNAWNISTGLAKGEIYIFVNPDAQLNPDCVSNLTKVLDQYHGDCLIGGKLYYPDSRIIQHAGGMVMMPRCNTQHRGHRQEDSGQFDSITSVDYVTGAVLGCTKQTWNLLNGFDTSFFPAYYEDVDLCWRLHIAGGDVIYHPGITAFHAEASSLGSTSPSYIKIYNQNRLLFVHKHLSEEEIVSEYKDAELRYLINLEDWKFSIVSEAMRDFGLAIRDKQRKAKLIAYVINEILNLALEHRIAVK